MSQAYDIPHGEGEVSKRRFPIRQDVQYTCRMRSGVAQVARGETVYMSSSEVGFTTERTLKPGQRIEVAVNWPALLDQTCHMKLVIYGHVIRNDANAAAVKVERYEFRTRATHATVV